MRYDTALFSLSCWSVKTQTLGEVEVSNVGGGPWGMKMNPHLFPM